LFICASCSFIQVVQNIQRGKRQIAGPEICHLGVQVCHLGLHTGWFARNLLPWLVFSKSIDFLEICCLGSQITGLRPERIAVLGDMHGCETCTALYPLGIVFDMSAASLFDMSAATTPRRGNGHQWLPRERTTTLLGAYPRGAMRASAPPFAAAAAP
jgi:hypothetical protein